MKPMSPEARALIRAAHGTDEPDARARARVKRALSASVAASATSLAVSSAEASLGAAAMASTGFVGAKIVGTAAASKLVAGALTYCLAGAVAGVVVSAIVDRTEPRLPAVAVSTAEPPVAPPPELTASLRPRAPEPGLPAPPVRGAAPEVPSLRGHAGSLEEEARLLAAAERALRRGDLAEARTELDAYDRRFPRGALRQEAEGARVLIACQGGAASGRALAAAFARRYPGSPLFPRVRAACTKDE